MTGTDETRSDEDRLRTLFHEYSAPVLRYATRHVDRASAHDVVSEVFVVAWRRLDEVPDPPLPWLLGVAHNMVNNRNRSLSRQRRMAVEVASLARASPTAAAPEDIAVERSSVLAALAELTADQREALLLVAWDGLSAAEGAMVVGCSRAAFEVRVHRARARLRASLADDGDPPARAAPTRATTGPQTSEAEL